MMGCVWCVVYGCVWSVYGVWCVVWWVGFVLVGWMCWVGCTLWSVELVELVRLVGFLVLIGSI